MLNLLFATLISTPLIHSLIKVDYAYFLNKLVEGLLSLPLTLSILLSSLIPLMFKPAVELFFREKASAFMDYAFILVVIGVLSHGCLRSLSNLFIGFLNSSLYLLAVFSILSPIYFFLSIFKQCFLEGNPLRVGLHALTTLLLLFNLAFNRLIEELVFLPDFNELQLIGVRSSLMLLTLINLASSSMGGELLAPNITDYLVVSIDYLKVPLLLALLYTLALTLMLFPLKTHGLKALKSLFKVLFPSALTSIIYIKAASTVNLNVVELIFPWIPSVILALVAADEYVEESI